MVYYMTTTFTDQKPADAAKRKTLCACGHIHGYGDAMAIGRFHPGGPTGWVAKGHPVRATREEAVRDVCSEWIA